MNLVLQSSCYVTLERNKYVRPLNLQGSQVISSNRAAEDGARSSNSWLLTL
jgi:hypothetical protein